MITKIGVIVVSGSLIVSGAAKLINAGEAVEIVIAHGIVPIDAIPLVLSAHVILSLYLGINLLTERSRRRYYICEIGLGFTLISLVYLIVVIIQNGWDGNCGCFPGLYDDEPLQDIWNINDRQPSC